MNALIHLVPGSPGAALLSVAGRPLLLRQIQWLRAVGCERIVVELPPQADDIVAALDAEPLGPGVERVPTSGLDPRALAQACGLGKRVLAVPADVIGDGDLVRLMLSSPSSDVFAHFDRPPRCRRLGLACVSLLGDGDTPLVTRGPGWAVRLRSEDEAFKLTLAVLDGQLPSSTSGLWPVQVHATRIRSGVWVARGAEIHDSAQLIRPVFIGANAVVARDAVVGPAVVVGDDALVSSWSRVRSAAIEAGASVEASSDIVDARIVAPAHPTTSPPRRGPRLVLGLALLTLVGLAVGARSASSASSPVAAIARRSP